MTRVLSALGGGAVGLVIAIIVNELGFGGWHDVVSDTAAGSVASLDAISNNIGYVLSAALFTFLGIGAGWKARSDRESRG